MENSFGIVKKQLCEELKDIAYLNIDLGTFIDCKEDYERFGAVSGQADNNEYRINRGVCNALIDLLQRNKLVVEKIKSLCEQQRSEISVPNPDVEKPWKDEQSIRDRLWKTLRDMLLENRNLADILSKEILSLEGGRKIGKNEKRDVIKLTNDILEKMSQVEEKIRIL